MSDHVLPETVERAIAEYQPVETRFELADDVSVVSNLFVKAGAFLPQHTHHHPHHSVVAHGRVNVWQNGKFLGQYTKGAIVLIPAYTEHIFQALDDGTVTLCIHNTSRTGEIEIAEEHQIV